jgi:hypothetical protein
MVHHEKFTSASIFSDLTIKFVILLHSSYYNANSNATIKCKIVQNRPILAKIMLCCNNNKVVVGIRTIVCIKAEKYSCRKVRENFQYQKPIVVSNCFFLLPEQQHPRRHIQHQPHLLEKIIESPSAGLKWLKNNKTSTASTSTTTVSLPLGQDERSKQNMRCELVRR